MDNIDNNATNFSCDIRHWGCDKEVYGKIHARDAQGRKIGRVKYTVTPKYFGYKCILNNMEVYNNWRGKGIGTKMMKEMEEQLHSLGCTELHFEASYSAVPFYEKQGAIAVEGWPIGWRSYLSRSNLCIYTSTCIMLKKIKGPFRATDALLNTYA